MSNADKIRTYLTARAAYFAQCAPGELAHDSAEYAALREARRACIDSGVTAATLEKAINGAA